MKVVIVGTGKTNETYLDQGIQVYLKRLIHYTNFELMWLPDVKKFSNTEDLLHKEGEQFLKVIQNDDYVVLCDEGGKIFSSKGLASFIEQRQIESTKRLIFIIGGAFGLAAKIRARANLFFSLSNLTFSHQMIRLFLIEQVYRAFTIIQNEKYHNE